MVTTFRAHHFLVAFQGSFKVLYINDWKGLIMTQPKWQKQVLQWWKDGVLEFKDFNGAWNAWNSVFRRAEPPAFPKNHKWTEDHFRAMAKVPEPIVPAFTTLVVDHKDMYAVVTEIAYEILNDQMDPLVDPHHIDEGDPFDNLRYLAHPGLLFRAFQEGMTMCMVPDAISVKLESLNEAGESYILVVMKDGYVWGVYNGRDMQW